MTDLETVRLCFLTSELSLLSRLGRKGALAEPPRLELDDILLSMTIEMDVRPGSVFCRSRSGRGDLITTFGAEVSRRKTSGIRPLDSLDEVDDGMGGGGIDRPEVVEGMDVLVDEPSPRGSLWRCDVDRGACVELLDEKRSGSFSRGTCGRAGNISFASSRTKTASSCLLNLSTTSRIPNRARSEMLE